MSELQIGIVGGGWMGKVHAMSYRMARSAFGPLPAEPVVAVMADVDLELAERAARECGVDRAVGDWRAIVDEPSIDIVDVCTPNDMHFEVAMAAIAAGKHVYCEKPLANTVDLARQMADAAERKGVITMVGFNYIQNPVHGLGRAAIAQIGRAHV
jgi:predicted dehydrogenase